MHGLRRGNFYMHSLKYFVPMKTILISILIFVPTIIYAQEKPIANYFDIGMCYNTAMESVNENKLNLFLSAHNYFEITNSVNINSLGISIRENAGQSMFKIIFHSGKSASNASRNNATFNLYGMGIDYLYDFAKTEKWLISPTLGLVTNSYHLNAVSQNSISLLTGKNLVENFQLENKFLCSLGLEVDRRIRISYINVFLGLRGYYNIDLFDGKWRTSNLEHLDNIPPLKFAGYGVSFNVRLEFDWDRILSKQNK